MRPVTLLSASIAMGLLACRSEPTSPGTSTEIPLAQVAAPYYIVTYLDSTGGWAYGINNNNQVVGFFSKSDGSHAFLWKGGVKKDLGTVGGQPYSVSSALAINGVGQVVGESSNGGDQILASLWQNDVWQDLGSFAGSDFNLAGEISQATGINATGRVVGWSYTASFNVRAFRWDNGVMRRLTGLEKTVSKAYGVNNAGLIVGEFRKAAGITHAFRWNDGVLRDLGTLGGSNSSATAINSENKVVGWSETPSGAVRAFLWQSGVMTDLGTLGGASSAAYGINGLGQVVGWSETSAGATHAFLWENGVMTDLGPGIARGINRNGWIVGGNIEPRVSRQGGYLPTLWKPSQTPPPVLPPGSITVGSNFFLDDRNGSINPAVDTVAVGRTVTWHWVSGTQNPHSVQSLGSPSFTSSAVMGGVGTTYSVTFSAAGTYQYNCVRHPLKMTGRIVVR